MTTVTIMRDGELTELPEADVLPVTEPGPPLVPTSVSAAQAKLALLDHDLYDLAVAAVDSAGIEAEIYWTSAQVFERGHPMIGAIGAALELSEGQIDDLFILAATKT